MESAGLCDVCGAPNAAYTCMICGKRVCVGCITVGGACKTCLGGRKAPERKGGLSGLR